jgi:hypothetical protein
MPLMGMLGGEALERIESAAEGGHEGARELASHYVGQGVGLMTAATSAGESCRISWRTSSLVSRPSRARSPRR